MGMEGPAPCTKICKLLILNTLPTALFRQYGGQHPGRGSDGERDKGAGPFRLGLGVGDDPGEVQDDEPDIEHDAHQDGCETTGPVDRDADSRSEKGDPDKIGQEQACRYPGRDEGCDIVGVDEVQHGVYHETGGEKIGGAPDQPPAKAIPGGGSDGREIRRGGAGVRAGRWGKRFARRSAMRGEWRTRRPASAPQDAG